MADGSTWRFLSTYCTAGRRAARTRHVAKDHEVVDRVRVQRLLGQVGRGFVCSRGRGRGRKGGYRERKPRKLE
jgi:hypothetical protein